MILTSFLDEAAEALGLYLEEEEDFLYLKKGEIVLEVWHATSANRNAIERTVTGWIVVYKRRGGKSQRSLPLE